MADLAGYRNRDAALALAVFLGRFWSSPARIVAAFPIDRRALTEHPALGLTEARVRGALAALEEIGFLDRQIPERGSRYRATEHGLHRKPVLWRFGSDYGTAFGKANAAAERARSGHSTSRLPIAPVKLQRPPATSVSHSRMVEPKSPKSTSSGSVVMGEKPSLLSAVEPDPGLEAALARWKRAVEG
ncbi:hypothetical protein [Bradyrhizobium sp. P5_C11_2]